MGSESKVLRPLFWTLILVGFVWFCFSNVSLSSDAKTMAVRAPLVETSTPWKRNKLPNYVSKRRVPNGPDPIHNRRTVKSRQPPVKA